MELGTSKAKEQEAGQEQGGRCARRGGGGASCPWAGECRDFVPRAQALLFTARPWAWLLRTPSSRAEAECHVHRLDAFPSPRPALHCLGALQLVVTIFLPAIIFVNLGEAITLERLLQW